VPYNSVTLV